MGETYWITYEFLMTFTGAVFVTNIVTHFIKDYLPDSFDKKIVTLITGIIVVVTNQVVFDGVTIESIYLAIINGFFVAAAAMGNYEILTRKTKKGLMKELQKQSQIKENNYK